MFVPGASSDCRVGGFSLYILFHLVLVLMFLLPGENLLRNSLTGHVRSVSLSIEEVNSTSKEHMKWEVSVPYAF